PACRREDGGNEDAARLGGYRAALTHGRIRSAVRQDRFPYSCRPRLGPARTGPKIAGCSAFGERSGPVYPPRDEPTAIKAWQEPWPARLRPPGRGTRLRSMTSVSLSKGGNVSLSKAAPNLTAVTVGLGWQVRQTT